MRRAALPFCLILAAIAAAGPETKRASRSFTFVYSAATKGLPDGAEEVRLWVPVPVNNEEQVISNVRVSLTAGGQTVSSAIADVEDVTEVGETSVACTVADIENGTGRSLCVETSGEPIALELSFDVLRYETKGGGQASKEELEKALGEEVMVPLGGKASKMAESIENGSSPLETGRALYTHTLERMRYDKPKDTDWGRGDAEWACDSRHGNCTDFHSYFIALARTKGIPARFEMGFPVVGGDEKEASIGGYHCWAYFWVDEKGWIPVDISEADKHAEKAEYFFGTLDCDRVTMTGGRDLVLTPAPAAGALNFFVYPHLEIDGKDASKTNIEKSFKRINR